VSNNKRTVWTGIAVIMRLEKLANHLSMPTITNPTRFQIAIPHIIKRANGVKSYHTELFFAAGKRLQGRRNLLADCFRRRDFNDYAVVSLPPQVRDDAVRPIKVDWTALAIAYHIGCYRVITVAPNSPHSSRSQQQRLFIRKRPMAQQTLSSGGLLLPEPHLSLCQNMHGTFPYSGDDDVCRSARRVRRS
jgi:hypothetical protein